MQEQSKEKPNNIAQKFTVEVRFVPLSVEEARQRSNRLQELLFKGAKKRAQEEEAGKNL